jgi:hypothetical protein
MGWEGKGRVGRGRDRRGGREGKWWEWERRGGNGGKYWEIGTFFVRYLLQNVDDWSEGKIILKSTLVLKSLNCSINKNSVLLFERHKPSPRPNTVILTNVTVVTSGKRSDSDTELARFVRLSKLYIAWSIKTSQVALCSIQLLNKRDVLAVLTVGTLRRISERVVTKLITNHRWFVSALCPPLDHSTSTLFARVNTIQSVVKFSCTLQIVAKLSV